MPISRAGLTTQLVIVAAALLACRSNSSGSGYFSSGCVVAGEKQVVFGGGETVRLDTATGAVFERRAEFQSALSCLADGRVVEVGPHVHRVDAEPGDVLAKLATSNSDLSCDRMIGSVRGGPERNTELAPALFPELGVERCARLNVIPARVLADGRVLLAAGSVPSVASSIAAPGRMGFYGLDLGTGLAAILGSAFPTEGGVHIHNAVAFGATRDASLIVGVYHVGFAGKDRAALRVVSHRGGDQKELVTISDMREAHGIVVSANGRFAGLRLTSPDGGSGRVEVIDVEAGRVAFSVPTAGTPVHVGFLADDSVIVASAKRQVERRSSDGTPVWRVDLEKSP